MADATGEIPEESKKPDDPTAGSTVESKDSFALSEWAKLLDSAYPDKPTSEVVSTAEQEKAKDAQHNRRLRRYVAAVVVLTFWLELFGMFMLLVWQGRGGHFHLNDWLIGTVANGVILQTIIVLMVIATDLFSKGGNKMPGNKSKD